jgi:hypothetical protein
MLLQVLIKEIHLPFPNPNHNPNSFLRIFILIFNKKEKKKDFQKKIFFL